MILLGVVLFISLDGEGMQLFLDNWQTVRVLQSIRCRGGQPVGEFYHSLASQIRSQSNSIGTTTVASSVNLLTVQYNITSETLAIYTRGLENPQP